MSSVNFGSSVLDHVPIFIERAHNSGPTTPHVWLNSLQCIGINEKRNFHCAVVSPERKPRRVGSNERHRFRKLSCTITRPRRLNQCQQFRSSSHHLPRLSRASGRVPPRPAPFAAPPVLDRRPPAHPSRCRRSHWLAGSDRGSAPSFWSGRDYAMRRKPSRRRFLSLTSSKCSVSRSGKSRQARVCALPGSPASRVLVRL